MSSQDMQSGDVKAVCDSEIERLARERAEIEESLQQRNNELEGFGEFDEAKCVDFEQTSRFIKFHFQTPNGRKKTRKFKKRESKTIEKFMAEHNASTVTDMLGASHTCVRTDRGWQLRPKPTDHQRLYITHVADNGALAVVYWPSLLPATAALLTLVVASTALINNIASATMVLSLIHAMTQTKTYNAGLT